MAADGRTGGGTGGRPVVSVLGGNGFLGSAVTAELLHRNRDVRVVCRRPPPTSLPHPHRRTVIADLGNPGAVAGAIAGSDAVIVLAAHRTTAAQWRVQDTDPAAEQIIVGLLRDVVEAVAAQRSSASAPIVLMAGSAPADDLAAVGADPYARLKARAEDVLVAASVDGLIRGACLRLPTVYGRIAGGDRVIDQGVITAMARRALADEPLTIWHPVRRNLLHVRDAATAFAAALDHGDRLSAGCWAVGGDRQVPLTEAFEQIARIAAQRRRTVPVAVLPTTPPVHASPLDAADVVVDSESFRSITGWVPSVPDEEGLRDLIGALADEAETSIATEHLEAAS
jgi:dTDP-4-keto-6-deoxyhexose 4-ketoreductase